jgi:ABC-type glycerol-3-phosphate transport system permease component
MGNRRLRQLTSDAVVYLLLAIAAIGFLLPLVYMVGTSLKEPGTEFVWPPTIIPEVLHWENYAKVFELAPFLRYFANSVLVSTVATFGAVLSGSLAAYAFARLNFPGRNLLFWLMLASIMVPMQVTLIPLFIIFSRIGWIGTYLPVIVPPFFGIAAWAIFLLRQYFLTIPRDLIEAAEIDGASPLVTYWMIILPLSKPALATVTVLFFMNTWNDFLTPLIFLRNRELLTVPVALSAFQSAGGYLAGQWTILMAATVLSIIPIFVLFLFAQRYFVRGVVMSGLKG